MFDSRVSRLVVSTFAMTLGACSGGRMPMAAAGSVEPLPTVVVISFDALAYRFIDRDTLPNFQRLMRDGVRAPFRPEFPSKTFPNHYSMATGLTPGEHGIVLNQFYDASRKQIFSKAVVTDGTWFSGEPIWETAERAGLKTAAYYWTGSEAKIRGHQPAYFHLFDPATPDSTKIGEIMGWLRLPEAQRPHLVMMYSNVVDVPGHKTGPDGAATYAGVREADRVIGFVRDSLAKLTSLRIDLIIVSDHGLSYVPKDHEINADEFVPKRAIVDNEHATLSIWRDPANPELNMDSLATELRRRVPHTRVFRPTEFPGEWHTGNSPRFGEIFLLADPGWEYVWAASLPTLGEHGYAPDTPDMMGTFLAVGPDFKPGVRLPERENRTLRDLLVRLLRMNAAPTTNEKDFGLRQ